MSWQTKIFNKYRLYEKGIKIISDCTGLLNHPVFIDFLSQENKTYAIVKSSPEILDYQKETDTLIIGYNLKVPSFITDKYEVINFHFSDIPYNGNTQLLSSYPLEEATGILTWLDENSPHEVISPQLLEEIMLEVKKRLAMNKLNIITAQIYQVLNNSATLENVLEIAGLWAELQYKSYLLHDKTYTKLITEIDNFCNPYFQNGSWQEAFFYSTSNPKTIDKLIHKIKKDKAEKRALLCFDCMGLPEWLLLKNYLNLAQKKIGENLIFTLIPSVTSIARSALFAGTYTVYNKKNPGQSSEEMDLKAFFGEKDTVYLREKDYSCADVFLGYKTVSILFNFFDDLSHASQIQESNLSKFGYYNAVQDYLKNSRVKQIVFDLLQQGFALYICSDHGSTIAKGNGKIIDKYLQNKFAKRGTIISKNASLLTEHRKIEIPFIKDKLVVIPENREMFAQKNKYEINHGGITIDEMVVPFIKIENT
jgi:hypothetical protein